MSLRLTKSALYRKRIWDDASQKASQYYKARKNKLDLTYVAAVTLAWNPLYPGANCARRFRYTVKNNEFTEDSAYNCKIEDDMHDRMEAPRMEFKLKTPVNTTVKFPIQKWKWWELVQELTLWCDYARSFDATQLYDATKFDWAVVRRDMVGPYEATGEKAMDDPVMDRLPELHQRCVHQRGRTFFQDLDQPMQAETWISAQSDSGGVLPAVDGLRTRAIGFRTDRTPQWCDDYRALSYFEDHIPALDFDYIVTDDYGLVYPLIPQISNARFRERLLENADCYSDTLEHFCAERYAQESQTDSSVDSSETKTEES